MPELPTAPTTTFAGGFMDQMNPSRFRPPGRRPVADCLIRGMAANKVRHRPNVKQQAHPGIVEGQSDARRPGNPGLA
jgi:hypothetical protein